MLKINPKPDAVKVAIRIDRWLRKVDEKTRDQVLNMLWFHYIGRHFDWWPIRLKRKSKEDKIA